MSRILIGNIISLTGALIMVALGFVKKKKQILAMQCVQNVLMGTGNWVLGGYSAVPVNVLTIVRNLVSFKRPFTLKYKIIFIAAQLILNIFVNNLGLIGWCPVIAGCIFTWFLDTKNEQVLKAWIIVAQIMWAFFDITVLNYTSFVFDILAVVSNSAGIIMLRRSAK